jgi:hypothetical protein
MQPARRQTQVRERRCLRSAAILRAVSRARRGGAERWLEADRRHRGGAQFPSQAGRATSRTGGPSRPGSRSGPTAIGIVANRNPSSEKEGERQLVSDACSRVAHRRDGVGAASSGVAACVAEGSLGGPGLGGPALVDAERRAVPGEGPGAARRMVRACWVLRGRRVGLGGEDLLR